MNSDLRAICARFAGALRRLAREDRSGEDSTVNRPAPVLRFGAVTLVPGERVLLYDGRPIALTPKAFDLLVHFARHPGRLLTKDDLLSAVWPDVVVEESNLAYHVFAIRKALGEAADGERLIETVPKRGYRFVAPVSVEEEAPASVSEPADEADTPAVAPDTRPTPARRTVRPWILLAAGFVLGALVMLGFEFPGTNPRTLAPPERFEEQPWNRLGLTSTAGTWPAFPGTFQIAPDGQHLAAMMAGDDGVTRIWVRSMSEVSPFPLQGTETLILPPLIWSPDSRSIAYDATGNGALRRAALDGGSPQTVCDLNATAVGGSWSRAGTIIVGNAAGGIMRCPAGGGVPIPVTRVASEIHLFPSFLSDERHFIYLRVSRTTPEASGIYMTALDADPAAGSKLLTSGFAAAYVPAIDDGPGIIVFGRDGALFAQRFDEGERALTGEEVKLAEGIGSFQDYPFFSASETTLVYREAEPPSQLTWFDRNGAEVGRVGTADHMTGLALSPNGDRVLVVRHSPGTTADQDLWVHHLARGSYQRATFTPALEFRPVWVSNDRFLYTPGGGGTGIYEQTLAGENRLLSGTRRWDQPTSSSSDGRLLLYSSAGDLETRTDVWLRDDRTTSGDGVPLITGKFDQAQASLSPDQRLVAYVSNESGMNEVYVAELHVDPPTGKFAIRNGAPASQGGGFAPRWRGDSGELFYLKADGSVMALRVDTVHGLSIGRAERLFAVPGVLPEWGVTTNGRRFLFAVPTGPPAPYHIIRNWQSLLRK